MKELRELGYENNIIPTQRLFSDDIDNQLLPEYEAVADIETGAVRFGFDLADVRILQDDENAKATRIVSLVAGAVWSVAEGREALHLRPASLGERGSFEREDPGQEAKDEKRGEEKAHDPSLGPKAGDAIFYPEAPPPAI